MTDAAIFSIAGFSVGAIVGMWFGILTESWRWMRNADAIQRIESGGKLYKVTHE